MISFPIILQLIIGGILLGGIYALAAFGLSLIFGVSRVLNIAHGDMLMLGALMSYGVFSFMGVNPFYSLFIILPFFFAVGMVFERFLIRPIAGRPQHEALVASVLITLGASLTIADLTSFFTGADVKGISYSLPPLNIGLFSVSSLRLLVLGVILVLTLCLHFYLRRTFTGMAIRAITQEREGAMLVGVNISRVSMVTFGIGTSTAAAAGMFFAILFAVTPFMGIPLTVKYLAIIVLGGLGSLVGSLVGGLILGLTESFTGFYLGTQWSPTVAFLVLILILLFRPRGLFGIE